MPPASVSIRERANELLCDHLHTNTEHSRRRLLECLCPFVARYPGFVFQEDDEDYRQEFVLAFLGRFDSILAGYDPSFGTSFMTYLSICLRNLHWSLRRPQKILVTGEDALTVIADDRVARDFEAIEQVPSPSESGTAAAVALQAVRRTRDKAILCLHFFEEPIPPTEFEAIVETAQRPFSEVLAFIDELRKYRDNQTRRKAQLEETLDSAYSGILRLEQRLGNGVADPHAVLREVETLRARQDRYLHRYRQVRYTIPASKIAPFMALPRQVVDDVIRTFRHRVRRNLHTRLQPVPHVQSQRSPEVYAP